MNPSLQDGYDELEVVSRRRPNRTEHILTTLADRLRHKRNAWRKRPDARRWLSDQSFELAKILYSAIPTETLAQEHERTR
jgi:hypothetical protein